MGMFSLAFNVDPTIAKTSFGDFGLKAQSSSEEKPQVVMGDLEGPDYIQAPKHYKTLEMMLAEANSAKQPGAVTGPSAVTGTRRKTPSDSCGPFRCDT